MTHFRFITLALAAILFLTIGSVTATNHQTIKPPITIVTDNSWEVSGQQTKFGEYSLSAEQAGTATSPLHGGTFTAVAAKYNERSTIVPGTVPIWRNHKADEEGETYQFRKNVQLGADPIQKLSLIHI